MASIDPFLAFVLSLAPAAGVHELCHWVPLRIFGVDAEWCRGGEGLDRLNPALKVDLNAVSAPQLATALSAPIVPVALFLMIMISFLTGSPELLIIALASAASSLVISFMDLWILYHVCGSGETF